MAEVFLMLIKVSTTVRSSPNLTGWINEIEEDYMEQFGDLGASVAHVVLDDAPWDFALLFPGSSESVTYLSNEIMNRASDTTIVAMRARDLDDFRAQFGASGGPV